MLVRVLLVLCCAVPSFIRRYTELSQGSFEPSAQDSPTAQLLDQDSFEPLIPCRGRFLLDSAETDKRISFHQLCSLLTIRMCIVHVYRTLLFLCGDRCTYIEQNV